MSCLNLVKISKKSLSRLDSATIDKHSIFLPNIEFFILYYVIVKEFQLQSIKPIQKEVNHENGFQKVVEALEQ